jgi:hypothetical protein
MPLTSAQFHEIEAQRQYSTVQIVPAVVGDVNQSLVPIREWMAERCDVVVAIGGRHWDVNRSLAGVPEELEETLARAKPGFVLGAFGGAIAGYLQTHNTVFPRLRNGLTIDDNRALASSTDIAYLINRIISQIQAFATPPRQCQRWTFVQNPRIRWRRHPRDIHGSRPF